MSPAAPNSPRPESPSTDSPRPSPEALTLPSAVPAPESVASTHRPSDGFAPAADVRAAVPGHELLGELGRGAMGVVYKARQDRPHRPVALKMILAGDHAGDATRTRFRTETEAIAQLQHPNVVQVYEVGECGGLPFFSMEFCSGGSLEKKLAGAPLPPHDAARLVEQLTRAVQAAHERGIIHRDLKPGNVLLTEDGTPKISDFGLAKRLDEAGMTASGDVLGTPSSMAPEQAAGDRSGGGLCLRRPASEGGGCPAR